MQNNKDDRLVLVADDNIDAGDSLGSLFESLGVRVVVVRDGEAAVQAASCELPCIAILDLGMPRMDGWEACRRIRALPGGSRARLVALSGWGTPDARARSIEAGFESHWTKPAEVTSLIQLLDDAAGCEGPVPGPATS